MRPAVRRSRIVLLTLLGLFCFASFLFLAIVPADFSSPIRHEQLISDNSLIRQSTEKLNSIKQEISENFKLPAGIVLREKSFRETPNSVEDTGIGGLQDDDATDEVQHLNGESSADGTTQESSNQAAVGVHRRSSRKRHTVYEKVNEMEDQLIMARSYLQFAAPRSNSHLVRELRIRIKEIEKVVSNSRGSNLPRGALQRIRAMEDTLSKAKSAYPDCSAMASKIRAMTQNTEEQLRAQKNQASYLIQLAANTFPKGLHCLSMRLTTEYFTLEPEDRKLSNADKAQQADLYHYVIFSDNILASAVVVNSTISTSQDPGKIVFHVVTDSLNFPAMTMWFLMNPPDRATIQIVNMDEFKWLPPDFSSSIKQSGVRDPRFISPLNHLRFYLPDIFPNLNKVLLLDHDVVVQKDLQGLWEIDMKGKVVGVVETCDEDDSSRRLDMLVDFSDPIIAENFDAKACLWAFGMNIIDLNVWRERGLTRSYDRWLQLGNTRQSWKAGSLPLGQLTFYNHTLALNRQWHITGLGQDSSIERREIERAAVVHYDGNMKPWLEIGVPRFRGYWTKFLNYDQTVLQQCNIHE